jgi:hypothetical protein
MPASIIFWVLLAKPGGENRHGGWVTPKGRRHGWRCFYCYPPQADRWILPQAKSKAKTGMDAGFGPRKG